MVVPAGSSRDRHEAATWPLSIELPKILKWTGIVGGLAVVLAFVVLAGRHKSSGWSSRPSPRSGWHLETGYLVDFSAGAVDSGVFLSGRWYRFGPIALQERWRSRIVVTNQAVPAKIWRAF